WGRAFVTQSILRLNQERADIREPPTKRRRIAEIHQVRLLYGRMAIDYFRAELAFSLANCPLAPGCAHPQQCANRCQELDAEEGLICPVIRPAKNKQAHLDLVANVG